MSTVMVIDHQTTRGGYIQALLEANRYDTVLSRGIDEAVDAIGERWPDAIFVVDQLARQLEEDDCSSGIVYGDLSSVDLLRLDALLLLAMDRLGWQERTHIPADPSLN